MKAGGLFLAGILVGLGLGFLLAPRAVTAPAPPGSPPPLTAARDPSPDPAPARLGEEAPGIPVPDPFPPAPAPPPAGDGETVLRVRVVDGEGAPRAGVRVRTKFEEESEGRTDGDGVVEFRGITPGQRWVSASGDGVSSGNRFPVAAGTTTEVPLTLATGACALEGIVSRRDRGPVPEVSIGLHLRSAQDQTRYSKSDEAGRYRFDDVPAGVYNLTAIADWIGDGSRYVIMKQVEIRPGSVAVVDIVGGTRSLFGTVRDADSGDAIAGARVSVQGSGGSNRSTKTDSEGTFELFDVMAGEATVQVSMDGYGYEFLRSVAVTERETRRDVVLRPASALLLAFTDGAGRPVSGRVILSIRPTVEGQGTGVGTSVTADEGGRAAYRQILPGSYTIRFITEGRTERTLDVTITPGENALEVKLP